MLLAKLLRPIVTKRYDSPAGLANPLKTTKQRSWGMTAAPLISIILMGTSLVPSAAHAGVISDFLGLFSKRVEASTDSLVPMSGNLQTMPLPKPAMNLNPAPALGGGDVTVVDDSALVPAEGPSGTIADIERPKSSTISKYVVRQGDTLTGIAKLFNVTSNTVLWANDLSRGSVIHEGEVLTILPVTGVKYTVKSGDSFQSVAKKYKGDVADIASFNGLDPLEDLAIDSTIIIPDGELAEAPVAPASRAKHAARHTKFKAGSEPAHDVGPDGNPFQVAYYAAPLADYVETQGIHGYNAVDLGASNGTPILASAGGEVVVAKQGGWNGGYGSYIVIQHGNDSQTLYGHASRVIVGDGEHVEQGQVIGYVGSTGKSTGSHLHFEIRNGIKNPF